MTSVWRWRQAPVLLAAIVSVHVAAPLDVSGQANQRAVLVDVLRTLNIDLTDFDAYELKRRVARDSVAGPPPGLDIWVLDLSTTTHERISTGGGYLSPLIDRSGRYVWFVRGGRVWRRSVANTEEELMTETDLDARSLVGWDAAGRTLFIIQGDGFDRISQLDVESGLVTSKNLTTEVIQKLFEQSRLNSERTLVFDDAFENNWELLMCRVGTEFNKRLTHDSFVDRDPSWWGDTKIVYVSDRR